MDGRKLIGGLITVALVVTFIYMRFSRREDASKEVYRQIREVVTTMKSYEANRQVVDDMCKAAHEVAFADAYSTGGRRSRDRFDERKYITAFFKSMVNLAEMRQKKELEQELRDLHVQFDNAYKTQQTG
jgi:Leu/Phe-tRNA-protein transferase